jgi:hypothetical protein
VSDCKTALTTGFGWQDTKDSVYDSRPPANLHATYSHKHGLAHSTVSRALLHVFNREIDRCSG